MEGIKASPQCLYLMTRLKKFLSSTGMGLGEFLQNFQSSHFNQLSKMEFLHIVSMLAIDPQAGTDPLQVFAELAQGKPSIDLGRFKQIYSQTDQLIQMQKQEEARGREDEMRRKMVRVGLFKLSEYIRVHPSPMKLFREFDLDGNESISKQEFNRLLLGTDIPEFANREIRSQLINHIFKYYKGREITMQEICTLFKVKYEPALVKPHHMPEFLQVPQQTQKAHPQPTATNDTFGKKKPENPYTVSPSSKPSPNKGDNEKIHNVDSSFPKAMKFYRLGMPTPSEYEHLQQMEEYLSQGKRWEDPNEPKAREGKYMRARDIFGTENYHIFQMASSVLIREVSRIGIARQIQPKDIIQGSVGDCYFLSSIASLISIYPQLIAERFLFGKNSANYYAIKLFIDGQWKVVATDDRFPCVGHTPIFAKPHNQEIWVMLLEKCWAKVFGSYEAINSGSSKEGFLALTGAPCQVVNRQKDNKEEIIKILHSAHKNRYVATMSGSQYLESLGKAGEEKLGLVSEHAYSLLKVLKTDNQILLKIRNPWGKTVWKGDWSFKSPLWTPQLRKRFNYNHNPDDGSFYMPWKEFVRYFGQIVICKLNPTYLHSSLPIKAVRDKSVYLRMRVKTAGQYIITLYQESKRKYAKKYDNYGYSKARVVVSQKIGDQYKYVGAKATSQSLACTVDLEHLDEGEYVISATVWWKFWDQHETVVTTYGVDHTSLSPQSDAIAERFNDSTVQTYAAQFAGTGKVKSYEKYGFNATCETNFSIETGLGFIRMVNNSQKTYESTQKMQSSGIDPIPPTKLPLRFNMTPHSQKTCGFFVSASGYEYSSTENISYKQ